MMLGIASADSNTIADSTRTQRIELLETITEEYKGFVLRYLKVPLMGGMFTVNVASNDLRLFARLAPDDKVITDHKSIENGIAVAKGRIDLIVAE